MTLFLFLRTKNAWKESSWFLVPQYFISRHVAISVMRKLTSCGCGECSQKLINDQLLSYYHKRIKGCSPCSLRSRDSSVGIPTSYGMGSPGSIPGMAKVFSSPQRPDRPPIQWIPGEISLRVKRPGREADHSLPSSAEVGNGGAIPPLPNMSS
jgi:hypothetical protein